MGSIFGSGPEAFGGGRPMRRSRTWNENGIQYTQEENSYIGPNLAYFTMSRTNGSPLAGSGSSRNSQQNRRTSLLGRMVNGIADYMIGNHQHTGEKTTSRQSRRAGIESSTRDSRKRRQRPQQDQDSSYPSRRPQNSRQSSTLSGRSAFSEDYTSSDESEYDLRGDDSPFDAESYAVRLAALESAAEYHRREAKLARRQLGQACRQLIGNSHYLQNLAQKVESHENDREIALRDIKHIRKEAEKVSQGQPAHRKQRSHQSRPREQIMDDFENDPFFNDPFSNDSFFSSFPNFHHQHRSRHSNFERSPSNDPGLQFGASPFAGFEGLFAEFARANGMHSDVRHGFFNIPGASFTASFGTQPRARRFSTASDTRPQYQQSPSFAAFEPQPRPPPAALLKPEEAQQLFKTYNERWNTVNPSDPNVPFPARGLNATSLAARNALWAPSVSSPIEAWSAETVMKANTQAFFLGAVGMRPAYSEAAGAKIELGIDKGSGSPAQVKQLLDILKKERIRWHSDRLGKRNSGRSGANDALQRDERARAVYHGVCELIEAAQ